MTRPNFGGAHRERGIFLIEIVLALVVLGMIAAAVYPLLNLASRKEADNADRAALSQAREALLAYAVRNGGFPGPLQLLTESSQLSRTALAAETSGMPTVVSASTSPYGAVPTHLLGTPRTSSKGTLFNYDVHPALRADKPFDLTTGLDVATQGLSSLHAMNRDNQGTGNSVGQLCRNVNTLIDMERRFQALPSDEGAYYRVNLPRTWQTGLESLFSWTSGLFRPLAAANDAWVLSRSSPQAFMVTRPQALALARLDRANAVFANDTLATDATTTNAAGYRIYEHPSGGAYDAVNDDLRDYAGWSNGATLLELRNALQAAGQCMRGADACLNTEVRLTTDNALTGQEYASDGITKIGSVIGLPLYWAVNPRSAAPASASSMTKPGSIPVAKNATIASGLNSAACVPLRHTANFTELPATRLDIYTVLPGSSYWLLASLPLQGASAVLPSTALDSGSSHAATVKCYASSPIKFEPNTLPNYKISTGGDSGVSCLVTTD